MRPIDADALIHKIKAYFCDYLWASEGAMTQEDTIIINYHRKTVKIIEEAPTVERPRGEWIVQDEGRTLFTCSYCKGINHKSHEKFCSDCGADMRGEGE